MTENQHRANIENAQKSTGPRTEDGKRRASLSARRHQLTSKVYIAEPGEMEAFIAHCAAFKAALAPAGPLEEALAEEIAHGRWRLKRARAIECAIFAQGHVDHADSIHTGHPQVDAALAEGQTWLDHAPSFALLSIYEIRIRRALEKSTAELKAMQADRKAAEDRARADAPSLAQSADSEGKTMAAVQLSYPPPPAVASFVPPAAASATSAAAPASHDPGTWPASPMAA